VRSRRLGRRHKRRRSHRGLTGQTPMSVRVEGRIDPALSGQVMVAARVPAPKGPRCRTLSSERRSAARSSFPRRLPTATTRPVRACSRRADRGGATSPSAGLAVRSLPRPPSTRSRVGWEDIQSLPLDLRTPRVVSTRIMLRAHLGKSKSHLHPSGPNW
jgi:hypothetical protein